MFYVQTGGRGVDHVIEVGGAGTILKSIASVRYAGVVSVIGFVAGVRSSVVIRDRGSCHLTL